MTVGQWLRTSSLPRYLIIGSSAFLIDFGLLNLGVRLGWPVLLANTISTTVAIIFSFLSHRYFTFKSENAAGYKLPAHYQAIIFVIVSLIAIGLSDLIVHYFVAGVGYSPSWSKIIASAALFIYNYVVNRTVTFRGATK